MRGKLLIFILIVVLLISCKRIEIKSEKSLIDEMKLPEPKYDGEFSVERALYERRSVRSFRDEALSLEEVSQLLWAAQGIDAITGATRRAPSAGATYPLEIYLVVKNVDGLNRGVYHYDARKHTVRMISNKDIKQYYYNAPVFLVIAAVYERTTSSYGSTGIRYVDIEVGHAAQNVHLQAISLGLGSFPIGAFGGEIKDMLGIEEEPLYIIPVGRV